MNNVEFEHQPNVPFLLINMNLQKKRTTAGPQEQSDWRLSLVYAPSILLHIFMNCKEQKGIVIGANLARKISGTLVIY